MATREEILRYVVKAQGGQEIAALAKEVRELGDESGQAEKQANALLDEFANTARLKNSVTQLREVSNAVLQYQRELRDSTATINELAAKERELTVVEKQRADELAKAKAALAQFRDGNALLAGTTKQIAAAQKEARAEVQRLTASYRESVTSRRAVTTELERERTAAARASSARDRELEQSKALRRELDAAGVSTKNLATAEKDLEGQTVRVTDRMRQLKTETRSAAAQAAALQRTIDDLTEAERRETRAREAANDSIDELARKSAAATAATKRLAEGGERVASVYSRVRGIVAAAFAGLSVRGIVDAVRNVLALGDSAERTRNQFGQLYGDMRKGDAALVGLRKLSADLGIGWDSTRDAAVKLKAFGIDPLNGSLRALIDENAAMGGSQERLEGVVLALGQAWTKQKFQAEEALQLAERGVPVWDLLSKATGKSTPELLKLSEAGKLGRREISLLFEEIGKANSGAASKAAGTLSGLFTQLSSRVRQFFTDVSNRGPLDFFKGQLRDAIATVDRLAKSNDLEIWARKIGSAIVSVGKGVADAGRFIVEHADAIVFLAKAYAAVKIGGFLSDLGRVEIGSGKAEKGVKGLAGAIRGLPANVQIAIALVGLELAAKGAAELGDAIGRNLPATKEWEERTKALNEETRVAAERYRQATESLGTYRDVQVKSNEAIAVLTEQERTRYREGVEGLERYLKSQVAYYDALRGIGQLNDEGLQHLAGLRARLAEVEANIKTLDKTAAIAGETLKSKLSENARLLVRDLESAGNSSKQLGDKLGKAFESIDTSSIQKVGDIGLAVAAVARESDSAARAVASGLGAALRQVSGEDLLKFQSASIAAFEAVGLGIKDTAIVLDTTLLVGLEKLGVAPEKFALGMSTAGKQSIAIFQAIMENARATSAQIEAAFVAATKAATSTEDVEALGAALKAAADLGRISMEGAERAGAALQNRIREIAAVTDPLADSFSRLGIKSQASLNATRDSAREAFEAIVDGARRGEASQYDVQRAFDAYAQTAREAVAGANQYIREQVEAQLRAEAAAVNVKVALVDMGEAGELAGKRAAAGANEATEALGGTADAAKEAASSADDLEVSANGAASGLNNIVISGNAAGESAINASAAFADAAQSIQGLDRVTFNLLDEQQRKFDAELASVRASNEALDERAQILSSLRSQYSYLSDAQLQVLANEKAQMQQAQERRREEDLRKQQQQNSTTSTTSAGGVLRVEVVADKGSTDAMLASPSALDKLTREIATRLKDFRNRGGQGPW